MMMSVGKQGTMMPEFRRSQEKALPTSWHLKNSRLGLRAVGPDLLTCRGGALGHAGQQ